MLSRAILEARSIDYILKRCSRLPLGLHTQADNTCREGKNQQVIRWAVLCVLLGCFRWVTFGYLRTAHTHENLDQVFAQVASVISGCVFNSAKDVLDILGRICRRSSTASGASSFPTRAFATKLDETACWQEWSDRANIKFAGHAQKGSPHYMRICRREDIGLPLNEQGHPNSSETLIPLDDFPEGQPRHGDDIVVVIKEWLADLAPIQIIVLVPVSLREKIRKSLIGVQPSGVAPRMLSLNICIKCMKMWFETRSSICVCKHLLGATCVICVASTILDAGWWLLPSRRTSKPTCRASCGKSSSRQTLRTTSLDTLTRPCHGLRGPPLMNSWITSGGPTLVSDPLQFVSMGRSHSGVFGWPGYK